MESNIGNIFSKFHPAVVFLYIAGAVFCTMFTLMPVCVILSLLMGSIYSIFLNGFGAYAKALRPLSVMFLIIVLINPLTNHRGLTILFYLFGNPGIPITWEATLFGLCSGGMLVSVFIWFRCYQTLITNDKFMYLFGSIAPTSSMVVSMVLKLVPVTIRKYHEIDEANLALNKSSDKIDRKGRIRTAVKTTGVLLSRTMEDSIETADSMRARGYGSGKRTRFKAYKLRFSDIACIIAIGLLLALVVSLIVVLNKNSGFFPIIRTSHSVGTNITMFAAYTVLLGLPFVVETRNLVNR